MSDEWVLVPSEPTDEMLDSAQGKSDLYRLDIVRAYRAMLDAAPAAPQQAESVSAFQRSAPERIWLNVGDISDEDRFEDVSNDGCEWICWCKDSQDKNDVPYVRADLAHPPPAEVHPAEPVAWRHDHGEDAGGFEYYEGASCPDCQPLYLHPPAAQAVCDSYAAENQQLSDEVQRLRDAARDVCEWADAAQWALGNETGVPAAKLDALRRALEG